MKKFVLRLIMLLFFIVSFNMYGTVFAQDIIDYPQLAKEWYKVEMPKDTPFIMYQNDKYMARIRILTYTLKKGKNPLPKERMEFWIKGMKKKNQMGMKFTEIEDGITTIDGLPTYWKIYRHGEGEREVWEKNYLAITPERKVVHLRFTTPGDKPLDEAVKEFDNWINQVIIKK